MKENIKRTRIGLNVFTIQIIYLCILIVFATIMSILVPSTLYIDLAVILITAVGSIYVCFKEIQNRKYRVSELSKSINGVLKENLKIIDLPLAMFSTDGEILWKNSKCEYSISDDKLTDSLISIQKKLELKEKMIATLEIGNDITYTVKGNILKFDNCECILLVYIDSSKERELTDILDKTKTSVGIIYIDNFDETMQGLDEIVKSDIVLKLDKLIRSFVKENGGIVTKLDKDRYVMFIEKQYIVLMKENTFEILEKVKNITNTTKLPITISIGISYSENELNERYKSATSALDIALGRGGDQVVLKNDKKYEFFGGTNLVLEKTSRVRARTIAQALKDLMEKSDNIYIIGHKNTDIDCIGAAVGVYKIANSLGKNANIIVDAKYNNSTRMVIDRLQTQEEYNEVFLTKDDIKKIDYENSLLIVVDTHKKTYLAVNDIIDEFDKIVVIDHHRRGPEFIDDAVLTYHELYASSTSELVTELLMYLENIKLTPVEAETIYAGILVDTKNFTFKTGVKTFEAAAYLRKAGLDIVEVKQIFQNDFETYVAKVEIVKNAEIVDSKIAISVCDDTKENMPVLAAQAADELLSITGILASFVLCKVDNVIMISGRSMGDINVQSIMENMGGGGHLTFAGAQIAGVTIEEAKQKLKDSIEVYFGKINSKDNKNEDESEEKIVNKKQKKNK